MIFQKGRARAAQQHCVRRRQLPDEERSPTIFSLLRRAKCRKSHQSPLTTSLSYVNRIPPQRTKKLNPAHYSPQRTIATYASFVPTDLPALIQIDVGTTSTERPPNNAAHMTRGLGEKLRCVLAQQRTLNPQKTRLPLGKNLANLSTARPGES